MRSLNLGFFFFALCFGLKSWSAQITYHARVAPGYEILIEINGKPLPTISSSTFSETNRQSIPADLWGEKTDAFICFVASESLKSQPGIKQLPFVSLADDGKEIARALSPWGSRFKPGDRSCKHYYFSGATSISEATFNMNSAVVGDTPPENVPPPPSLPSPDVIATEEKVTALVNNLGKLFEAPVAHQEAEKK